MRALSPDSPREPVNRAPLSSRSKLATDFTKHRTRNVVTQLHTSFLARVSRPVPSRTVTSVSSRLVWLRSTRSTVRISDNRRVPSAGMVAAIGLSLARYTSRRNSSEGGTKSESRREKDRRERERERERQIFGYAQPTRQDRILARSARAPASPTRRFQLLLSALTQRSPLLLAVRKRQPSNGVSALRFEASSSSSSSFPPFLSLCFPLSLPFPRHSPTMPRSPRFFATRPVDPPPLADGSLRFSQSWKPMICVRGRAHGASRAWHLVES